MRNDLFKLCMPIWALTVLYTTEGKASTTYIGTVNNGAAWTVTVEGPSGDVSGTAKQYTDNSSISISSDGEEDGTFVAGATAAAFDGAWWADLAFFLPANATDIVLTFDSLVADDRTVLELNGTAIGNYGFGDTVDSKGKMAFDLDIPLTEGDFSFTGDTSGTITTGFVLGGENDLRLWSTTRMKE